LDHHAKQSLCDAMVRVNVKEGDNIITQGDVGDYFYIIQSGKFSILVDDEPVSELEAGRSFGELALMFNAPRAATVQAKVDSVVYALDRKTFRMVLANSQTIRINEIKVALMKVPLLAALTESQIAKVTDIVTLLPFPAGDVIIKKGIVAPCAPIILSPPLPINISYTFITCPMKNQSYP
jgi:signal-transduction protein with cAMP-binding, CBS, and nucleotidyltransferase domain